MELEKLKYLINQYKNNVISAEDELELMEYIKNNENLDDLSSLMDDSWEEDNLSLIIDRDKSNELFNAIVNTSETIQEPKYTSIFKGIKWIYAAAAIALITLSLGILLYPTSPIDTLLQEEILANDITPGKNNATLTLPDGKQINLEGSKVGKIGTFGNITLSRAKNGELIYAFNALANSSSDNRKITNNIITTPRGGEIQIDLPDGSTVWLNSDSEISIPSTYNTTNQRNIELKGEAYFEVAHNKDKPFLVSSRNQVVKVLGTRFNINSYEDEIAVKTTLLEGSVNVNNKLLKPGQQAINISNKMKLVNVDTEMETGWKEGVFIFNGQDFKSIMRSISRWYDVEIVYDYTPKDLHLIAQLSKFENVSEILKLITSAGDVNFKIEGRRIRVIK